MLNGISQARVATSWLVDGEVAGAVITIVSVATMHLHSFEGSFKRSVKVRNTACDASRLTT